MVVDSLQGSPWYLSISFKTPIVENFQNNKLARCARFQTSKVALAYSYYPRPKIFEKSEFQRQPK